MGGEHTATRRVGAPTLATTDVPGIADHEFEVVIIIDRRGHVLVVVDPLIGGNLAVLDGAGLEGVQELSARQK